MTDRLTKNELTWLLAQEARTAAQKLRRGVGMYSGDELPTPTMTVMEEGSGSVEGTLNRLDEAVSMLASLHGHPVPRGRRGKIDLAALVWEVAPEARVQIEMGEGTTVFGDESELRRMLHVLIGQTGDPRTAGATPSVTIRREGDEIRVGVNLGPDTPAAFTAERGWLSRMATRYGGRLQLDGSMQTLVLAADVDMQRRELELLKKELAAAQAQGEAYARELAAVFSRGDTFSGQEGASVDSGGAGPESRPHEPLIPTPRALPPPVSGALDAAHPPVALAVEQQRRPRGAGRGRARALLRPARHPLGNRPRLAPLRDRPGDVGEIAASVGRHVTGASEVVADLARLGTCPVGELPRAADLADLLREAVHSERARAQRHDVELVIEAPESAEDTVEVGAVGVLFQVLIDHAIEASPGGTKVTVELKETPAAYHFLFDDSGPPLPPSARGSVLSRDFDVMAHGRPHGLTLIAASTIATHLRLVLELEEGPRGGTRARLVMPRVTS